MTDPTPQEPDVPAWAKRLDARGEDVIPLIPRGARPPVAPQAKPPPKSGILNIDKPAGRTSHDVVQSVRRASGERRVGHAGTLDPLATGVLVVCLGSATRVIEALQAGEKGYVATLRLGVETDTYDRDGQVVAERDASGIARAAVEAALEPFRGDIRQVPPMHSALKHKGEPLYKLARRGEEVERPARPCTVHHLELTGWSPPEITLELRVSKGTYVRSIAHDLGRALGVGAHLTALRRTKVGPFEVSEAEPLTRVVEAFVEGWWPRLMHPLDAALLHYPAIVLDEAGEAAVRNGQQVAGPAIADGDAGRSAREAAAPPRRLRAYNDAGRFVALLRPDAATRKWQPDKVFPKP